MPVILSSCDNQNVFRCIHWGAKSPPGENHLVKMNKSGGGVTTAIYKLKKDGNTISNYIINYRFKRRAIIHNQIIVMKSVSTWCFEVFLQRTNTMSFLSRNTDQLVRIYSYSTTITICIHLPYVWIR